MPSATTRCPRASSRRSPASRASRSSPSPASKRARPSPSGPRAPPSSRSPSATLRTARSAAPSSSGIAARPERRGDSIPPAGASPSRTMSRRTSSPRRRRPASRAVSGTGWPPMPSPRPPVSSPARRRCWRRLRPVASARWLRPRAASPLCVSRSTCVPGRESASASCGPWRAKRIARKGWRQRRGKRFTRAKKTWSRTPRSPIARRTTPASPTPRAAWSIGAPSASRGSACCPARAASATTTTCSPASRPGAGGTTARTSTRACRCWPTCSSTRAAPWTPSACSWRPRTGTVTSPTASVPMPRARSP